MRARDRSSTFRLHRTRYSMPTAAGLASLFAAVKSLPAWTASVLFHAGILAIFAAITWKIEPPVEKETPVSVVVSDQDQNGRIEYLNREKIKLESPSRENDLGPLLDKSAEATLDSLVQAEEDPATDIIGVDVAGSVSASNFSGMNLTSSYTGPSETFGAELAKLRKVGLNVAFVFDSTSSMEQVIEQTQKQIDKLMQVLFDLVPNTRIALVTYRDRGDRYVTRSLQFTRDRRRIRQWLFNVHADGGGDIPEAVYAALKSAAGLRWEKRAKRIILLFGDAGPHARDLDKLFALCRSFKQKGGIISTIVTDPLGTAALPFQEIAQAAGGEAFQLGNSSNIMKQLLILAFGSRWERHVTDELRKRLE